MTDAYLSRPFAINGLKMGGETSPSIQSMTNTDTNDVAASVAQCVRMIKAGAELVRLTTQGRKEVKSLGRIRSELRSRGIHTPVVADIHFNPSLALDAARVADKIRINPGNYLRGESIGSLLPQLLETCRESGTSVRIGVNHGSLDETILRDYGDTPAGMVESAMQFLRVCREREFHQVVVSMKSSNPRVMVQSVRLLVSRMMEEKMNFPLHLGVTEAGDGTEGRIKSVVGIAPLLLEGMGDTLRVSLTEPPENELPLASMIRDLFPKPRQLPYDPFREIAWDPFGYKRRVSNLVSGLGKGNPVKVIGSNPPDEGIDLLPGSLDQKLVSYDRWLVQPELLADGQKCLLLEQEHLSIQEVKAHLIRFCSRNKVAPVIFRFSRNLTDPEQFRMLLAGTLGALLIDGALDGVWVENPGIEEAVVNDAVLNILQASGARITKTEYIACPSCGRTHFDILTRLKEIRAATSHLTTLKIGVMGCIVNGPGEMADADYGYVGAGPGRVSIYKGRKPVRKNLPEAEALRELIGLMKLEGDWIDP